MKKLRIVAVSGGFDPLHVGHVRMFKKAKALGDKLVVIINNDNWLREKKGFVFMPEKERVELLRSLPYVDEVVLTDHSEKDTDRSVIRALKRVKPDIFANGGDRKKMSDIPEAAVCKELGIKMVFNVGTGGKVQSSSWMIQKAAESLLNTSRKKVEESNVFSGLYADAYDLMYADKEYDREAAYVLKALHTYGMKKGRMLSLGAGTLSYEIRLAKKGWSITAIDIAADMVAIAKEKLASERISSIDVQLGDMHSLKVYKEPFDAAIAMFNVLAYSKSRSDLQKVINGVSKNLRSGGLFIFDCWNAVAVKKDPPQSRFKCFTQNGRNIYRLTTVKPKGESLSLEIELIDLTNDILQAREREAHTVRSWSLAELKAAGAKAGLALVHSSVFPEWQKKVSDDAWPMALIFKKI